jgi:murein L,D-transpeptidase YcbB/YkuD
VSRRFIKSHSRPFGPLAARSGVNEATIMGFGKETALACRVVLAALSLGAASLDILGRASAAETGAGWRTASAPPAVVAQYDFVSTRVEASGAKPFAPAGAPPVVAWLAGAPSRAPRMAAVGEAGFDVGWELLSDGQRSMIAALDGWTRAPLAVGGAERRRLRAAIASAYAARGYEAFWRGAGGWNEAAAAAARRLREAGDDGLDLRAYAIPALERGAPGVDDELALSEAVAAYALQAGGVRVDPARVSHLIGARPALPEPGQALVGVAAAGAGAGDALQAFNPPHYGYQALRSKLAEMRSRRGLNELEASPRVAAAVDEAPRDDGPPAGSKAARRKGAVKTPASRLEAEIIANMERWRWLPRDMGEARIEVNIPDFELSLVRDGQVAHRARVIVGKEGTPTPVFSNALRFIIVNPYWNVPPSILNKEMLPRGGVETLEGRGFKVSYRHGKLTVRQPPGAGNALGRIKFMFPNDFAVYLHDTPSRGLFSAAHRAFSHGCMRVQEPFALAEAVLGPGSGWSEERVRRLIGGSERYINLAKPLPIHIEYFTAYVDEYGQLQLRGDLYGYSARVRRELGLGG